MEVLVKWDDGLQNIVKSTDLKCTGVNWKRRKVQLKVDERVKMWHMNKWWFGNILFVYEGNKSSGATFEELDTEEFNQTALEGEVVNEHCTLEITAENIKHNTIELKQEKKYSIDKVAISDSDSMHIIISEPFTLDEVDFSSIEKKTRGIKRKPSNRILENQIRTERPSRRNNKIKSFSSEANKEPTENVYSQPEEKIQSLNKKMHYKNEMTLSSLSRYGIKPSSVVVERIDQWMCENYSKTDEVENIETNLTNINNCNSISQNVLQKQKKSNENVSITKNNEQVLDGSRIYPTKLDQTNSNLLKQTDKITVRKDSREETLETSSLTNSISQLYKSALFSSSISLEKKDSQTSMPTTLVTTNGNLVSNYPVSVSVIPSTQSQENVTTFILPNVTLVNNSGSAKLSMLSSEQQLASNGLPNLSQSVQPTEEFEKQFINLKDRLSNKAVSILPMPDVISNTTNNNSQTHDTLDTIHNNQVVGQVNTQSLSTFFQTYQPSVEISENKVMSSTKTLSVTPVSTNNIYEATSETPKTHCLKSSLSSSIQNPVQATTCVKNIPFLKEVKNESTTVKTITETLKSNLNSILSKSKPLLESMLGRRNSDSDQAHPEVLEQSLLLPNQHDTMVSNLSPLKVQTSSCELLTTPTKTINETVNSSSAKTAQKKRLTKENRESTESLDGAPPFIQEVFKCDNIRNGFNNDDLIFVLRLLPDIEEMSDAQKTTFQIMVIELLKDVLDDSQLQQ
uniref:BESS domain-containing protein n=1 Tax=Graphocephala atropunctata TaxID=36148 RepID=A0A1B6KVI0_9HEMI